MIAELAAMGTVALGAALALALLAGVVKGMTGFSLPMILVSGLGSFLSPELALAGMILPALVTNFFQAFRQGARAALQSARTHWRYLATMLAFLVLGSQIVLSIPAGLLFLILGATITFFASLQLAGWRPKVSVQHQRSTEIGTGALAGILGGLTGTWGPPKALYLTALGVPSGLIHSLDAISCSFWCPLFQASTRSSGFLLQRNGRASLALWCSM